MEITPYKEERPWGNFVRYTHNVPSTVKILTVNPGEELSLQYHHKREEFWHIFDGVAEVTVGDRIIEGKKGDEFVIPVETNHTIKAIGETPVILVEIATGSFDESDIVRLKDKYHRDSALPST